MFDFEFLTIEQIWNSINSNNNTFDVGLLTSEAFWSA